MIGALAAAFLAVQAGSGPELRQIEHAIEANRLEQARQMLGDALAAGEAGPDLDRLLADLAFAKKDWAEAEGRYAALANGDSTDARSAERAAIAAIMAGDVSKASAFVDQAIASGKPSWKAWNAKGVVSDLRREWDNADNAFANAAKLRPDEPEILNNQGWSRILRGQWGEAIGYLEQASILDPKSARIRNNLELARSALAEDLPARRAGETDAAFAARLNDAGVVAEEKGDRARAIAAFSRALEVTGSWYARAANNLAEVEKQ